MAFSFHSHWETFCEQGPGGLCGRETGRVFHREVRPLLAMDQDADTIHLVMDNLSSDTRKAVVERLGEKAGGWCGIGSRRITGPSTVVG